MHELLSPEEMARADRLAAEMGPLDGYDLMRNAGAAVAAEALSRFGDTSGVDILCGPGNNGGDGYVAARLLQERGLDVRVWREVEPRPGTDAARAAADWPSLAGGLKDFVPEQGNLVIDALFGAGLARPLDGAYADALRRLAAAKVPVLTVDLPSGVSGESGTVLGTAASASLTVTFFRKKPGHVLYPGRTLCGEVVVADIGIDNRVLDTIRPRCSENLPSLWQSLLPRPADDTHKYERGHAAIFSGGPTSTGAARLGARAAARVGAGAVTLLSPAAALAVNAMHLTSIMLRRVEAVDELEAFQRDRRASAYLLGPGFGISEKARIFAAAVLRTGEDGPPAHLVLDADGITAFAQEPELLFAEAAGRKGSIVLTPHLGEFARLFPDLAADRHLSKLGKARAAAARSGAIVLLKGPDTIIASPDGQACINTNGTPYLATAGSGDVLAGMITGLLAQGMPAYPAAAAAAYLHAEAAKAFGPGLIAEDLCEILPGVFREFLRD